MSNRLPQRIAGIVSVVALLGLAAYTIHSWTDEAPHATLFFQFPSIPHLQPGAPIRILGVKSGEIDQIEHSTPSPDHLEDGTATTQVLLTAHIHKPMLRFLRQDAALYITRISPLGESYVEINPGSPDGDPVTDGSTLYGTPPPPMLNVAIAQGRTVMSDFDAISNNVETQAEHISNTIDSLKTHSNTALHRTREQITQLRADVAPVKERLTRIEDKLTSGDLQNDARQIKTNGHKIRREWKRHFPPVRKNARETQARWLHTAAAFKTLYAAFKQRAKALSIRFDTIRATFAAIGNNVIDSRFSIGAFRYDGEIQNDAKGLHMDLKRRFLGYVFSGGKMSSPAR